MIKRDARSLTHAVMERLAFSLAHPSEVVQPGASQAVALLHIHLAPITEHSTLLPIDEDRPSPPKGAHLGLCLHIYELHVALLLQ